MSPDTDLLNNADSPGASEAAPAKGGAKVELDIDDAPFLEEPEEEKPAPKPPQAEKREAAPKPAAKKADSPGFLQKLLADKKRLAIVIGGLVFVLVVLPILLMLILGGKEPEPVVVEPERIIQSGVPTRDDAPPGPGFLFKMQSFFVERRGSEGEIRFVRCSFSLPMENPSLFGELGAKNITVRDAVYYYLRNKPLTFLADAESREMLKQDLLSVVNEHLSADKVQELFFEEYLVSGN